MAVTVQQLEGTPASYPPVPEGLSENAADVDSNMVWQRIEDYTAYRFTTRQVVWIVEGEGEWVPPLAPATVSQIDCWENGAWVANTPPESPLGGYCFPGDGPYRVTADVGGGTLPAPVTEAFRRVSEYMAGGRCRLDEPGASQFMSKITDDLVTEISRNPAWMARAIQNSGAGDLLRNYRRAP